MAFQAKRQFAGIQQRLAEQALANHVPALGWTQAALAKAAVDLDLPASAHGILSPVQLTHYFIHSRKKMMTDALVESPEFPS